MVYGLLREAKRRLSPGSEPLADGTHCLEYYGVDYYNKEGRDTTCRFEVHSGTKVLTAASAPADRPLPRVRATLDPLPYDRDDDAFPDP